MKKSALNSTRFQPMASLIAVHGEDRRKGAFSALAPVAMQCMTRTYLPGQHAAAVYGLGQAMADALFLAAQNTPSAAEGHDLARLAMEGFARRYLMKLLGEDRYDELLGETS